jgi:hypothetical protein
MESSECREKIKAASDWLALRQGQPIAANCLSIKTTRAANDYFAGGVSAGLSAGVVAGGAGLDFGAGFFSAQPTAAIAVTSSINAKSFFMPWSPETKGTFTTRDRGGSLNIMSRCRSA